jgi:PAS domain S-box-containing protein
MKKDGSPLWANVTTTYVPPTDARPALLQNIYVNIDDRRHAEQALRASEERWRTVFETASVGIATSDASRRILRANTALQQMLGYTEEELQALGWAGLTHEGDEILTDKGAIDLIQGRERAFRAEKRYRHKDGEFIWVNVNASYVPATEVSSPGFTSIIVDVNDRKRAEQALRASEERWRSVFETCSVGIATSDENLRVATANATFQRMVGYSESELREMRWIDLTHEDDRSATEDLVRSLRDGQLLAYNMEKRYVRKDGETIWVNVYNTLVPATASTPAFFPAIIVDITDRIHAEGALHRSQAELARVARVTTMGELATSIAHEINQPLAAIVASGNACRRWLEKQNLTRAKESLERVIADADRACEVIKRVRSLTSKAIPEQLELNINSVVKEILAITRGELRARQVSLQLQLNDDIPPVRGDKVQLQQVVLNLVMNAIEAMAAVTGRQRVLAIKSQRAEDGGAQVTVQDCGPGLAPSDAERIFRPFFTTKSGGIGMGLSISTTIMEAHGGRLWASPMLPCGSAFHFSLPGIRSGVS